MMKKKSFILFLVLIFSLSAMGLPFTVNSCKMNNGETSCPKCFNDLEAECSRHKQEVNIDYNVSCCVKALINNGIDEEFLAQNSKKDTQNFNNKIVLTSSNAYDLSLLHGRFIKHSFNSQIVIIKLYLHNSVLLI